MVKDFVLLAAEKGEELAKTYNPNGLAPFPFTAITEAFKDLKINIVREIPHGVSGAIVGNLEGVEQKYVVIINAAEPKRRQYFTIGHELGHYFLHKEIIKSEDGIIVDNSDTFEFSHGLFRLSESKRNQIEIEANNFAASMLMPSELVRKSWESIGDVEECANLFQVSLAAMSIRLERLGLVDNK